MLQFVSSNTNKARELEEILQISIQMKPLELMEIQTDDLTELVAHKARNAFRLSPSPLLVEDTSIYFEQWGNCLLYTSPSPRDRQKSRMPSSA